MFTKVKTTMVRRKQRITVGAKVGAGPGLRLDRPDPIVKRVKFALL